MSDPKTSAGVPDSLRLGHGTHGARVLRGGGRAWAQCLCGWESHDYGNVLAASYAWADHVRLSRLAQQ